MLYLIGLGMNEKSISLEGIEKIEKCDKVYLENYTVEFPYEIEKLEEIVRKKIDIIGRDLVESDSLVKQAKKKDIALLVYGSPLFATTHIALIQEAKKQNVKYEVIYNASVLDVVAETGLQLYKFGKITSLPSFEADSFAEVIKENQRINSHSLILVDIGMSFEDAIKRIENLTKDKIVVCSRLGTDDSEIYYEYINNLKNKKVEAPFCFIITAKSLHFLEKEMLESFH